MRLWIALALLAVILVLMGVGVAMGTFERGSNGLLLTLALGFGCSAACVFDAQRLGKYLPSGARFCLFFAAPVAVPAYLIYSRGVLRGVLWTIALGSLAFVIATTALVLTSMVLWGDFPPPE